MRLSNLLIFGAFMACTMQGQAQGLSNAIVTADKAVGVVNQSLSGTWLAELRRASPNGPLPPIPVLISFYSDGSFLASPADGNQTANHGIWIRVGDRKFLGTGFFFGFNETRALASITKLRINFQLSADGKTMTGTTEAVVLAPSGDVLGTFPGTALTMTRLSPEIPTDFYDFQKRE
jgi:hypothetical protein